jgi:hypothetical protein
MKFLQIFQNESALYGNGYYKKEEGGPPLFCTISVQISHILQHWQRYKEDVEPQLSLEKPTANRNKYSSATKNVIFTISISPNPHPQPHQKIQEMDSKEVNSQLPPFSQNCVYENR